MVWPLPKALVTVLSASEKRSPCAAAAWSSAAPLPHSAAGSRTLRAAAAEGLPPAQCAALGLQQPALAPLHQWQSRLPHRGTRRVARPPSEPARPAAPLGARPRGEGPPPWQCLGSGPAAARTPAARRLPSRGTRCRPFNMQRRRVSLFWGLSANEMQENHQIGYRHAAKISISSVLSEFGRCLHT